MYYKKKAHWVRGVCRNYTQKSEQEPIDKI